MISLSFNKAKGTAYHNKDASGDKPPFTGYLNATLPNGKELRLEVSMWPKAKGDKKYYSISAGGISGALFPNEHKTADNHPDYTGSLGFDKELRLAGWKGESKGGTPAISIEASEKKAGEAPATQAGGNADFV